MSTSSLHQLQDKCNSLLSLLSVWEQKIAHLQAKVIEDEPKIDPEYQLFVATAIFYDDQITLSNLQKWFKLYKRDVSNALIEGNTKAQVIDQWFNEIGNFSKKHERTLLMKSLFVKHNLIYSDSVMIMYERWLLSYKPPKGISNRYTKMLDFICANKFLFTLV
jgi:hypothetical protein